MSNRFERPSPGFLDLAVSQLKKAQTFLNDVDGLINWRPIEKELRKKLGGNTDATGNPAYPSLAMFKVLLLQRWWNLSDRGMDDALADRISFRIFTGMSFGYDTPDSATICRFRNRLMELGLDQKLFDLLNQQLTGHELIVKQGVIVDASIVESSRRPRKKQTIEEVEAAEADEPEYAVTTEYSDDSEAKWTVKAGKPYYGYKLHAATDAGRGFILGGHITPANRADTREFMKVLDESKAIKGSMVFADKGYASFDNRSKLDKKRITDGIMYKAAKGRPLTGPEKLMNRVISGLRGKVERAFGTLKRDYGFQRTRYLGIAKVQTEFLLNAMAFNLKKAVRMMA